MIYHSKFVTSGMDKRSWKQENSERGNATYKGRKIVKGKKNGR